MPIKFRCQHCRQFLGISRAKAGEIFDCPTCGWTLRVPDLDGTIKPLPGPGLDLEDSKLAEALDELASMDSSAQGEAIRSAARSAGGTGIEGRVIDDRKGDDASSGDAVGAGYSDYSDDSSGSDGPGAAIQTMAEPIEIPPLPPPEKISIEPNFRARKPISQETAEDDSQSEEGAKPWKSTAQGGESWRRLIAAAEFDLSEGDSTDEPVKEAEPVAASGVMSTTASGARPVDSDAVSVDAVKIDKALRLAGSNLFALVGAGAALFGVGFWIGRVTTLPTASISSETVAESPVADSAPETEADLSVQGHEGYYTAFRGRITYRTESGERKPDRGARVIVLPTERTGTARLSVAGLRTGDQEEDQKLAQSGIRMLGGDVATTNDSGEFEIKLPGSGQYYFLALSNSLSQGESAEGSDAEKSLSSYFERPAQLLGRVMHHFEEVRYSGEGVTPWDFSFSER